MRSQDNSQLQVRGLPKRLIDSTWEECRLQGEKELKLQLKYKKNPIKSGFYILVKMIPRVPWWCHEKTVLLGVR